MSPIRTMNVFLNRMFTVFFERVSPDSNDAKPRCITKTSAVHNIIHALLAVNWPRLTFASVSAHARVGAKLASVASERAATLFMIGLLLVPWSAGARTVYVPPNRYGIDYKDVGFAEVSL